MSNLSGYERETLILFNEGEDTAFVSTYNRKLQNRLKALSETNPDCHLVKAGKDFVDYTLPKKWVKFNPPRELSEERLARLREQGKNLSEYDK